VDETTGEICADVLSPRGWSPSFSLRPLLLRLQSLFDEPNTASSKNKEAATLYDDSSNFRHKYWARVYETHEHNMAMFQSATIQKPTLQSHGSQSAPAAASSSRSARKPAVIGKDGAKSAEPILAAASPAAPPAGPVVDAAASAAASAAADLAVVASAAAAHAGAFSPGEVPSSVQVRDVSLREVSPGEDNHCFFNAVSQALGGKTPDELRRLLRQGIDKLDSVHLLARYDLFREKGVNCHVVQQAGASAEALSKRQQGQLRQFKASYTKRSVYTHLSMGGTPEMFLLSHALDGGVVFLIYSGVRGEDPHIISSIHALSQEDQEAIKSGVDGFVGAGSTWPPPRARFPPGTVQICLQHGSYRGLVDSPNHWDLFHFYVDGRSEALPCWPHYERESDQHELQRRAMIQRMVKRIKILQNQSRQLRAFAAQFDLSGIDSRQLPGTAHKPAVQRAKPVVQSFPCGEMRWVEGDDTLESAFELRMSTTAPGCLGVFAIHALEPEANSGVHLAYPSVIMTTRMHDRMMREGLDPCTGVKFQFADENKADYTLMRQIFQGFTAVGQPLRKGPLLNSVNTTGAASNKQNCRLMQMNDEQLTSVTGFKPASGPIPHRTVYVTLIRPVSAGEELLLNYGTEYWECHPVGADDRLPDANGNDAACTTEDGGQARLF
jgi:hypothetical protein